MFIENTQLIKYRDENFVQKSQNKEKTLFDCLGEEMLTDSNNSFRKLEFILGKKVEWSKKSLEENFNDFIDIKLGHINDYDYSLEDVFSNYYNNDISDNVLFDVKTALVRKHGWNFILEQDVYYRQRVNLRLFNINEYIAKELYHSIANDTVENIANYLHVKGNDLLLKKIHTKNVLIIFSLKEGRYLASNTKDNQNSYYFNYSYDKIIEEILN